MLNIPKQEMKIWIRALRSGDFKQARGTLQSSAGHCCLGVACELFIPEANQSRGYDDFLKGGMPDDQMHAPDWLRNINNDLSRTAGAGLTSLNDNGLSGFDHLTFDEIADVLQAVYIHEVLK